MTDADREGPGLLPEQRGDCRAAARMGERMLAFLAQVGPEVEEEAAAVEAVIRSLRRKAA